MRLHGRGAICAYLNRSGLNKNGWRLIRQRYGDVIYCEPGSGHCWALSQELDAVDKARCVTMTDLLASRAAQGRAVGEAVGGYPRECLKLANRILKPPTR